MSDEASKLAQTYKQKNVKDFFMLGKTLLKSVSRLEKKLTSGGISNKESKRISKLLRKEDMRLEVWSNVLTELEELEPLEKDDLIWYLFHNRKYAGTVVRNNNNGTVNIKLDLTGDIYENIPIKQTMNN